MAKKRLIQAINETLFAEMERDPKVILFGEDVEISMFGDTKGLHQRFGPDRIRNTPICEATLTGMAVGAAAGGYRVILHLMFSHHRHCRLRRRPLHRRAALRHALSPADEPGRRECRGPFDPGGRGRSAEDRDTGRQPDLLPGSRRPGRRTGRGA